MKISCPQCDAVYNIPEEKLPDRKASATCKKCGHRIEFVPPRSKPSSTPKRIPAPAASKQIVSPAATAGISTRSEKKTLFRDRLLRMLAFFLDLLLLAALFYFTIDTASAFLGGRLNPIAIGFVLAGGFSLLYFCIGDSAIFKGYTIGKRLMRIRVQDARGGAISIFKAGLRYLVIALPIFLFASLFFFTLPDPKFDTWIVTLTVSVVGASVYLFLFNGTGQALPDLAVGSFVAPSISRSGANDRRLWKGHVLAITILILTSVGCFHLVAPQLIQKSLPSVRYALLNSSDRATLESAKKSPRSARQTVKEAPKPRRRSKLKPKPISLLVQAAMDGDVGEIERLLNRNVPINGHLLEKDIVYSDIEWHRRNLTPLTAAAQEGQLAAVKLLIEKGADVNLSARPPKTPLYVAANAGHQATLTLLLDQGADVNAAKALEGAAAGGHLDIVASLLAQGADVNACRPLHKAVIGKSGMPIAKLLIENGADVNAVDVFGNTVLMAAAPSSSSGPEMIKLLIDAGADVNATTSTGKTAMFCACSQYATPENLTILMANGADVNHQLFDSGRSPLIKSAAGGLTGHVEILLNHGASIDLADDRGMTALMHAVKSNRIATAKLLLDRGADPTLKDLNGTSALDLPCHPEVKKLLAAKVAAGAPKHILSEFDIEHALFYDTRLTEGLQQALATLLRLPGSTSSEKSEAQMATKRLDETRFKITFKVGTARKQATYSVTLSNKSDHIRDNLAALVGTVRRCYAELGRPLIGSGKDAGRYRRMMNQISTDISHFDYVDLFGALAKIDANVNEHKGGLGLMYRSAEIYAWLAFFKNRNPDRELSDRLAAQSVCAYLLGAVDEQAKMDHAFYEGLLLLALDYPAAAETVLEKEHPTSDLLSAYIRYDFDKMLALSREAATNRRLAGFLLARAYEQSQQVEVASELYRTLLGNYPDFLMAKEYAVNFGSVGVTRQFLMDYLLDLIQAHLDVLAAYTQTGWAKTEFALRQEVEKSVREEDKLAKWLSIHKTIVEHPMTFKQTSLLMGHDFLGHFMKGDMLNALMLYYRMEANKLGRLAETETVIDTIEAVYPDSVLHQTVKIERRRKRYNTDELLAAAKKKNTNALMLETMLAAKDIRRKARIDILGRYRNAQIPDARGLRQLYDFHRQLNYRPVAVDSLENAFSADPYTFEVYKHLLAVRGLDHARYIEIGNRQIGNLYGFLTAVAEYFARNDNPDAAIDYYRRAIEQSPTQQTAYQDLGKVYLDIGQPEKAVETWQAYLEFDNRTLSAVVLKNQIAKAWMDAGKYQKAYDLLDESQVSGQEEALLLFARASEHVGKSLQAETYFKKAAERYPRGLSPAKLARFYLRQGNMDVAIQVFNEYKRFSRWESWLMHNIVSHYVETGDLEKATILINRIAMHSSFARNMKVQNLVLAEIYDENGLYEKAAKLFLMYAEKDEYALGKYWDTVYASRNQNPQAALDQILDAASKSRYRFQEFTKLSDTLVKNGHYDQAFELLQVDRGKNQSMSDQKKESAAIKMAVAWRLGSKKPEATASITQAMADPTVFKWQAAAIGYLLGEVDEAAFLSIAESYDIPVQYYYLRAIAKESSGQHDEALKDLLTYLNKNMDEGDEYSIAYALAEKLAK